MMLRLLFITMCMYCWGSTGFDAWRPSMLERQLTRFTNDVNVVANKGIELARYLPHSPVARQAVVYRQQASELIYTYFNK